MDNPGFAGPLLAVVLAWLAGAIWVRLVLPLFGPGRWPLIAGLGFPVGCVMVVVTIYGLGAAGVAVGSTLLWAGMLVWLVAGALASLVIRVRPRTSTASQAAVKTSTWEHFFAIVLGGAIAVRGASLLPDLLLRPIFPWDAWKIWAYKARVWFESGELLSMGSSRQWLMQPPEAYVIVGVDHPAFVSLILLWQAVAVGRWDDSLLGLPWLACGIACCLILYGVCRYSGMPRWAALLPVYLMISLPLVGTHIALVGYADLWMAMLFLMFAAVLFLWLESGQHRLILLLLVPAVAMVFVKATGGYWLVALVPAILAGLLSARMVMVALGAAIAAGVVLVVTGLDPVAWLSSGRFRLDWQETGPVTAGMLRHMFTWAEWHLLWYLAPVLLFAAVPLSGRYREIRGLLALVTLSLLVLFVGFLASRAGQYAVIGTLFSRTLLHVAPALILLGAVALWYRYRSAAQAMDVAPEMRAVHAHTT